MSVFKPSSHPINVRCHPQPHSSTGTCRHLQISFKKRKNTSSYVICYHCSLVNVTYRRVQTVCNRETTACPQLCATLFLHLDIITFIVSVNVITLRYLFDGLTFSNLRVSDHLVGGADLDKGELGVFRDLSCQSCLAAVGLA